MSKYRPIAEGSAKYTLLNTQLTLGRFQCPVQSTKEEKRGIMTTEERLLKVLFNIPGPKKTKNIHDLTEEERKNCSNGYNACINIIVDDFIVTGGTLRERCLLTNSDINMENTLQITTTDEILKVNEEEEITLYIFDDLIIVLSDVHYESNEDGTYYLPIETDLTIFEETDIEINDLRSDR